MKKNNLHKIAPTLSNITPSKTGFDIPENYFESIEDAIIAEIKVEKFQKKINKNTFKTPNNYFDSVEDLVITKLKAEALKSTNNNEISEKYFDSIEDTVLKEIRTTSKVKSLKINFAKFAAPLVIAASIILIFILKNNSKTITFDSLAQSEIENWINNGNIDIDAFSIASMYPEIELNNEMYSASISDDEVLEYLYEEDLGGIIHEN